MRQRGGPYDSRIAPRFEAIQRHPAVDDVSFLARAGEITGYLGPNGSGKSTTMKMITGLLEATSGKILFDGEPIEERSGRPTSRGWVTSPKSRISTGI